MPYAFPWRGKRIAAEPARAGSPGIPLTRERRHAGAPGRGSAGWCQGRPAHRSRLDILKSPVDLARSMPGCQEPGPLDDLAGSVKPYGRHVIVLTGRRNWMPHIEADRGLLGIIARDVIALGDSIAPKPKVTAVATPGTGPDGTVDLLVYPDAVRYVGVDDAAWNRIREVHIAGGRPAEDPGPVPLRGHDVLVCVHGARDNRCGGCGPLVAGALRERLRDAGRDGDVRVHESSHVGGHTFAGNVIVYPAGTWYGYVRPGDADALVAAITGGKEWTSHVRGRAAPDAGGRGSSTH